MFSPTSETPEARVWDSESRRSPYSTVADPNEDDYCEACDVPMNTTETFKRQLRNLESAYRRFDSGELTGRNCTSSDRYRDAAYRRLADLARTDGVCDALDADSRLAARWNRLERRQVGLPA